MSVDLYQHQKDAVERLSSGNILCGGVGTGKSRTALAFYAKKICGAKLPRKGSSQVYEFQIKKPLYVITTAKKRDMHEWEKEMAPFLLSTDGFSMAPVTVDSWNNIKKYSDIAGSFFIFDEQRLVGTGAWTKAFWKIAKHNEWVLLTATPGDSWIDYAPVFIANGFYRNITEFKARHVIYHRFAKYPKIERYVDTARLEKIRNAITVSMDYKKEATQHHEWVKIGYQEDLYKEVSANRWNIYKDEPISNASEFCYVLRKIVNDDPRRRKAVLNILKNHPKAILFYNFDYELYSLRDMLNSCEIVFSEWNGHKHEQIPVASRWVYLVNYTAGSEGWNCVETDTIIFYSSSYSYRATHQASGRIDRMNTPFKDLYYYHLFSDSGIDRSIRKCLERKKNFNEVSFFAGM